jgi:hypothetical protein
MNLSTSSWTLSRYVSFNDLIAKRVGCLICHLISSINKEHKRIRNDEILKIEFYLGGRAPFQLYNIATFLGSTKWEVVSHLKMEHYI